MIKYNLVIVDGNQCVPFLNLTEQAFYDKLWEWTWVDNLWYWIEEDNPNEEDIENIIFQFINYDMLHKDEDDDINCFAFINDGDITKEYQIDENIIKFVHGKIKEHNEQIK